MEDAAWRQLLEPSRRQSIELRKYEHSVQPNSTPALSGVMLDMSASDAPG